MSSIELSDIVPEYQSKFWPVQWLFRKRLELAREFVKKVRPRTLLDAGCGDGSFLKTLYEDSDLHSISIHALDTNPGITRLASIYPWCEFKVGSILKTGFSDGAFDAVTSLDMLEHLSDAEPAVLEIRRIIRDGGYLITSEPVESLIYKSLRFLIKGTFSEESGPGSSPHYNNARGIDLIVRRNNFSLIESKRIPLPPPLDLFHINLYRKDTTQ